MRGLLAVARREVVEKRSVLAAAAIASLLPLAVPVVRGLTGAAAVDARSWTALLLSAAFAAGLTIGLGVTMLAPEIASRRIGFDFARPLSAFAIWGGRLAAACLLAIAAAAVVWVPAWIGGAEVPWRDLTIVADLPWAWPLILLGALAALFAACHAFTLAFRSRSGWITLDAALALASGFGVSAALARLPLFMAATPHNRAVAAFAGGTAFALLAAGYASVAGGRTDIRAAHRALSIVLWSVVAAAILGVNGYAAWVMAARPSDLKQGFWASPAPAGTWVELEGIARDANAAFLYDAASGRFERARVVDWRAPLISSAGNRAVWIEGRTGGGPFNLLTLRLDDPKAKTERTRLLLPGYPSSFVLSNDGSRLATVENGVLSIHDMPAERTLASARVADGHAHVRGFFVANDRFRVYRAIDAQNDAQHLDILELDVASRTLAKTGQADFRSGGIFLVASPTGDRLVVIQYRDRETLLLDARTGALLRKLAEGAAKTGRWAGFLSSGRIVLSEGSKQAARLRLYLPVGSEEESIPLPSDPRVALGGEVEAGRLIVAVGEATYLVDLASRATRKIADDLYPAAHLASYWDQINSAPAVGSEATKLFYGPDHTLVRLDPLTGERRVVLGRETTH